MSAKKDEKSIHCLILIRNKYIVLDFFFMSLNHNKVLKLSIIIFQSSLQGIRKINLIIFYVNRDEKTKREKKNSNILPRENPDDIK